MTSTVLVCAGALLECEFEIRGRVARAGTQPRRRPPDLRAHLAPHREQLPARCRINLAGAVPQVRRHAASWRLAPCCKVCLEWRNTPQLGVATALSAVSLFACWQQLPFWPGPARLDGNAPRNIVHAAGNLEGAIKPCLGAERELACPGPAACGCLLAVVMRAAGRQRAEQQHGHHPRHQSWQQRRRRGPAWVRPQSSAQGAGRHECQRGPAAG